MRIAFSIPLVPCASLTPKASSTLGWVIVVFALSYSALGFNPLTATIPIPTEPSSAGFNMGTAQSPIGSTITVDTYSLRLNGKPWTPVMGEFHFSRYPENEWRDELLKMKAGGLDIVATYVFWIHHEEIEGQFDWSGCRNLRQFIRTADEVGLKAIVRCGPWCHGEVRNGGLPDWILQKGWRTRSNDPNYLDKVAILYRSIADQLRDLLWKDGGPVIGIQLENEYGGAPEHLLSLKRIAREVGLDVPLYTKTGWPRMHNPLPFGEILPLFGVYAEGFWDRELTPMPGNYRAAFHFNPLRTDSAIATDQLGSRVSRDEADVARYPYLTCEIGGGMMSSYHRRISIHPADVETTTLVKLGSGSTSLGYYMYHGGVNPEGKLTTLMESQATGYWNDMPVKNYDFQAPLGQYGQVREQYHLLRRIHLFLKEWGHLLAGMPAVMPDQRPTGIDDITTLRWTVRSNGEAGLVFVNNYERLRSMPAKQDVQFSLRLPDNTLTFPSEPVTIPADARFFWPFNFDLGHSIKLKWATAQPICAIDDNHVRTVFFAETTNIPVQFNLDGQITQLTPKRSPALELTGDNGNIVRIVVLNEKDSACLWKGFWQGRERVFMTETDLLLDDDTLRLSSDDPSKLVVDIYPKPTRVVADKNPISASSDGVFSRFTPMVPEPVSFKAEFEHIESAGSARAISLGKIQRPVAEAPIDADFERASVWRIKLPTDLNLGHNPILRIYYTGDVARVTLNHKLITDDFYNGRPLDIGLLRHATDMSTGDLHVMILPLRKDAPIYMAKEDKPEFGLADSVVELKKVEVIPRYHVILK